MTPTTTRAPRPPRPTVEQLASRYQTGQEYKRARSLAIQTAAVWWVLLAGAVMFGTVSAVQSAQALSVYTDVYRPMPPKLRANMQAAPPSVWTLDTTRQMLPQGWTLAEFARRAQVCAERPTCAPNLKRAAWWWWTRQPGNNAARAAQWFIGGVVLLSLPALMMQAQLRGWSDWESATIAELQASARRAARGGRTM